MKRREKIKQSFYTVFFTAVITAVCVSVVSFAYQQTKPMIKLNEELFVMKSVLDAAGLMPANALPEKIADIFKENVKTIKSSGGKVWYEIKNGNYVIPVTGTGLWGKIDGVVGVKKDLTTLTGISFVNNNETPGLGARITEKWFCGQFRGKTGPMTFVAEGTKNIAGDEFDGITGATVTTTAVKTMVNNTLKNIPEIVGGTK